MTSPRTAPALLALLGCLALSSAAPPPAARITQFTPLGELPCAEAPVPVVPVLTAPCPPDPPPPVVAIRVRVAAASEPGKELEYRIGVHNLSAAPAHHVLVRNPLPPNARFVRATPEPSQRDPELQWQLGTLPSGCCREIVLVLAPTDTADVKNCARVQFEHGQCVVTRLVRSVLVPVPIVPAPPPPPPIPGQPPPMPGAEGEPPLATGAKLALQMTGPVQQYANLPAKYQITVTNTGTAPATNVQIVNPLPAGTTLVSASAGGRVLVDVVAWNLGTLEPGGSRTVQIALKAKAAGKVCNQATARADGGLQAGAEVCTVFEGLSALALETVDTRDPLPVGEQTSYTIVVTNQGTVPVTNLRIKALVPPQLKLLRATGASDPPPPDKLPAPTAEGQLLPYAPLPTLAPGAEARFEVFVQAAQAGDARFKVELTADQLERGPVREDESTQIFAAPDNGKGH